ncbi:hypothetical protein BN77_0275 [Rhizobium mesoamericanum STM3625]|uniref:Transposase n=1 Tax=Rhizobium mesoamericanum STM3625 TaxID=1211777 RepID=K0PZQ1_9HYPH|nr:hypothetical protein BN77_0275 [Rhizobium mesoamericanum STM3625]
MLDWHEARMGKRTRPHSSYESFKAELSFVGLIGARRLINRHLSEGPPTPAERLNST